MSRAARITVGSVIAGVLAFVALVSGVMAAAGSGGGGGGDPFSFLDPGVDTPATAEVLDVDDYDPSWPTVDVRWTTPDGEVVVTYVDWEWGAELPEIGDRVEVLYAAADPELAYAADDPYVSDLPVTSDGSGSSAGADVAGDGGETTADGAGDDLSRTAGWVSLAALLGLLVTAVVTVVAAVRAPAAPAPPYAPTGFDVLPPLPYPPAPGRYGTQPYAQQPYAQQPYAQQPYAQQSSPPRTSWPHPG